MQAPKQALSQGEAFVLSYRDVAKVLSGINLGQLIFRLASAIEIVYKDAGIRPVKRMGWSTPPDALEIMGCKAADFTCIKLISSMPVNNGAPTVTGTLLCTEIETDQARLVCDAAFLTPLRTAATTALIMSRARPSARSLGIVGAGLEGIAHAIALTCMSEEIESIRLLDLDRSQANAAVKEIRYLLDRDDLLGGREVEVVLCEGEQDLYECDVLVTATFAEGETGVLRETERIADGTFIAAVGADLESKRELPDRLYGRSKFIADDLQQCLEDGELQYAKTLCCEPDEEALIIDHRGRLANGRIVSAAEFLEEPGLFLERDEGITIYDSAGFSGQDLAVARVMLEILKACNWPSQPWNPSGSRSLVELLGCNPLP